MDISKKSLIKSSIFDLWSNLGKIITISLLWGFILLICIFFLPTIISIIVFYLIGLPLLTGNVYAVAKLLEHEKYSYRDSFIGAKILYVKSLLFYAVIYIASFILGASFWQYNKTKSKLNLILLIIQSFFYFYFLISHIYTIPLMIKKNMKFGEAFKNSFKMAVDDPIYSIKSWLMLFVAMLLSIVGFVTIPLFSAGIFGVYSMNIYQNQCDTRK